MNGDIYSLEIVDQTGPTPYGGLFVSFNSPASPTGTPVLDVKPFMAQRTGIGQADGSTTWYAGQQAQGSGISFYSSQGADPDKIDTGAFDAVTITILAMPTADRQPLTVRIQMHFVDGKTLDEPFSNRLVTSYEQCGAG